ncbi:murein hydrolase activator EnvC family protein [Sphingomicrobium astaxanthinifaciens]|uniref:murein hydrolase activator EnvC family protein n=1 Tax=Sphingomicrobium astaxanthinifaciens TaxID=1227949 RepID=UPI001FCBE419|nr:peptidoglycan DD-metalloendopeptidase family protein [Sphingomicrobium astaxanthinifaciens]MCJ7421526.1 peptidoglycan DD-metalloendopeptidase family protein [Sphingomicrobium astaxanthinifaciens]
MRPLLAALLLAALAGQSLAAPPPSAQTRLDRVRAEAREAEARAAQLARQASAAEDKAAAMVRRRQTIAARIEAAEARLAVARIEQGTLAAAADELRADLEARQAPAAALLAGLASLSRRPPILTLADARSIDELIATQAVIEAVVPLIEARTLTLRARHAELDALVRGQAERTAAIAAEQARLAQDERALAALQQESLAAAQALGIAASRADARAIAAREQGAELADAATREAFTAEIAAALAGYAPAPPAPADLARTAAPATVPPFRYRLPARARVTAGLGSLTPDGVRARGLTMALGRGSVVRVPADGEIAFAGPFRGRDGIVIIDHGAGWFSLIANVATDHEPGDRVRRADALGRALGPIGVELWHGQRPVSPALIAGSS